MKARIVTTLTAVVCFVFTTQMGAFAAGAPEVEDDPEEHVELIWRYPQFDGANHPDLQMVEDAANEIINAEINASVRLEPIPIPEYDERMNAALAAGERMDLVYSSWWTLNYFDNIRRGAFQPMDDLLEQYAPTYLAEYDDYIWDAARVEGSIYGIAHHSSAAGPNGLVVRKDLLEQTDFDPDSVEHYRDFGRLFEQLQELEPDKNTLVMGGPGFWGLVPHMMGMEQMPNEFVLYRDDPDLTPHLAYETPEYAEYLEIVREWYDAGYINEDAATVVNAFDLLSAGDYTAFFSRNFTQEIGTGPDGSTVVNIPVGQGYLWTNVVLDHVTAISHTSRHPERAMQLIDLVRADEELWRTLTYGVEGVHWEVSPEGFMVDLDRDRYNPGAQWMFGHAYHLGLPSDEQDAENRELYWQAMEEAEPSKILGFQFDDTPVSSAVASVSAAMDEFIPALNTGTGDPDEYLPRFLGRLEGAGIWTIQDELIDQLEEWKEQR